MRLHLVHGVVGEAMVVCACACSCSSPYGQSGTPPKNGTASPSTEQPARRLDAGAVDADDEDESTNAIGKPSSSPPKQNGACLESCKQMSAAAAAILEEATACAALCPDDDDVCFADCEVIRAARCDDEVPGECELLLVCADGCS